MQKNMELGGSRTKDTADFKQAKLAKMKSMKMQLNEKAAMFHFLDTEYLHKKSQDLSERRRAEDSLVSRTKIYKHSSAKIEEDYVELEHEDIMATSRAYLPVIDFYIIEETTVEESLEEAIAQVEDEKDDSLIEEEIDDKRMVENEKMRGNMMRAMG